MKRAKLIYVMGPSGAGKDTLLAYARPRVDPAQIVFAHRYITRAIDSAENHVALTREEFAARREAGLFAHYWESHGFMYAIGAEVDVWRTRGLTVVVSGARAAWLVARTRYPDTVGVLIDAPASLREKRLSMRGREDEAAIRERLNREVPVQTVQGTVYLLDNCDAVAIAGDRFVHLLQRLARS